MQGVGLREEEVLEPPRWVVFPPHLSLGHRLEPVTSKLLQGLPNSWSPSVYSWALAAQTKGG